ncbi:MAG TPA: efflux RND transporter periplasmic adaptor subunit [Thermoanaerobaculia bacterium]|nr:efflux RND transporter periplasmic adaptor subunit [Thermoanaerobaculia bacterium]
MKGALYAAALVELLSMLSGCHRPEPQEKTPPPGETWLTDAQIRGARLTIEPVGTRTLAIHLVTAGRVVFDEGRVAHVFSPVSGRVTKVVAAFGQRVGNGDPLAVIESPDLGSAWSDLLKARAELVAAEHELERQKNLFEHQAAAERDYEAAQDNAAKSRAEVGRAQLRLKMLHASENGSATQEFLLRSPIAGEIVNRTATPGLEVQGMLSSANIVAELFTVGDIGRVWVWGDLYERDLGKVRRGQKISITSVAYPGRTIPGVVDYVAEALDPQSHTARIRCVVQNSERLLKPEMYVTLGVELDRRETLALPRTAVVKAGDRQTVFVEDGRTADGRTPFRQRAVELGETDDGWVSVASGLSAGERVVVSGSILLSGGSD